jgi:hypothetical protein
MRILQQQPGSGLRFLSSMRYNTIMLIGCDMFEINSTQELSQELVLVVARTIKNTKIKLWLKG